MSVHKQGCTGLDTGVLLILALYSSCLFFVQSIIFLKEAGVIESNIFGFYFILASETAVFLVYFPCKCLCHECALAIFNPGS